MEGGPRFFRELGFFWVYLEFFVKIVWNFLANAWQLGADGLYIDLDVAPRREIGRCLSNSTMADFPLFNNE